MSKIIGIEQSLSNIENALKAKGFEVIQLRNEEDAKKCDACIITGQDRDIMGISDPVIDGPVIDADGLSANDVVQRVEKYFH
ncbi:YkuS family protein [Lysinibacillus sp. FSL H8-0500]|uniref:YkuS family protein n=1 Tax=Lysinibacillus sp. FSL H8-0500 TaxID=2921393 RepID=UPI003100D950